MITEMLAGKRLIPVTIETVGKKLALSFQFCRPLIDEVKSWKGAEWDPENKRWLVTDCERNHIQIELCKGETPPALARYMVETIPHVTPNRPTLMKHQLAMLDFVMSRRRCILAAEMGTGKSLVAIEVMEASGQDDWWWVAPAKVLRAIELELSKWQCTVSPKLVSYDSLRKILERWVNGTPAPHGVIFDESSRVKSPGAQRTKAAQALADAVRRDRDGYVVCMTGSPAPKDPCDWWAQAEIACPGYLREASIAHLRRRLIDVKEWGQTPTGQRFAQEYVWKTDEVEKLKRRLGGLVDIKLSRDCQDLPEIRREIITCPATKDTLRAARLIANTAGTALEALSGLRQLSDGFQYSSDGEPTVSCPTPKDDALIDILARYEEVGRIIIYAGFRASVDRVNALCVAQGWDVLRCDGRGWAYKEPINDKAANKYLAELDRGTDTKSIERLAFVAHPLSGGLGLNLTACPAAVYYSSDFNFESRIQSEKRGHRQGMDVDRGFCIYDICHLPTDKYVLDNLLAKKSMQAITMGDIREVLGG